jgi:hypothetical protein
VLVGTELTVISSPWPTSSLDSLSSTYPHETARSLIKEFNVSEIEDNNEILETVKKQLWIGWHFTQGGDGSFSAEIQLNDDLLSIVQ